VHDRERRKRLNYKPPKKHPYSDIDLVDSDATRIVSGGSLADIAKSQINGGCKHGNQELCDLIDFLVKVNVHSITSKTKLTYSNGQLSTPLGVITSTAISRARKLLNVIGAFVSRNQFGTSFVSSVEQYLRIVPMKVRRKFNPRDIFPNNQSIVDANDLLDAMESVTLTAAPSSDGVTEKVFNLTMKKSDKSTVDRISRKFSGARNRMHSTYGMRVMRVWEIDIASDEFDDSVGNVQELWHGTKASNLLSMLKLGMKLPKNTSAATTGAMFGAGIYTSDQSTKALQYAKGVAPGQSRGNTGRYFMFLTDVAMGKPYTPPSSRHDLHRTLPRGYDSCFARANRSGVRNNEMIVYREDRVKIRYLVEFTD
jgi:poly [ADP-ribose] polymerase